MKHRSMRLSDTQDVALERLAEHAGLTVTDFIRSLVHQYSVEQAPHIVFPLDHNKVGEGLWKGRPPVDPPTSTTVDQTKRSGKKRGGR